MSAWAVARPVYCLTLEISSYYRAANLSSTQLYSEFICSIRLHNTLTEGTPWSFLQAVDQVSATHAACSRRRLYLPWDAATRKLGMGEGWYEIPKGLKNGRWSGSKKGTGLIDRRSEDFFSSLCLPSATLPLPAAFSFALSWQRTRWIVGKGLPWKGRNQSLISSSSSFSPLFNFCV